MARWCVTAWKLKLAAGFACAAVLLSAPGAPARSGEQPAPAKSNLSGAAGDAGGVQDRYAAAPSLSSAQWVGFTPVLVADRGAGAGSWIAGPFAETGSTGWVADTLSGLTVEVQLIWRDGAEGGLAELSAEAGERLGLSAGAVTNVAVYIAR